MWKGNYLWKSEPLCCINRGRSTTSRCSMRMIWIFVENTKTNNLLNSFLWHPARDAFLLSRYNATPLRCLNITLRESLAPAHALPLPRSLNIVLQANCCKQKMHAALCTTCGNQWTSDAWNVSPWNRSTVSRSIYISRRWTCCNCCYLAYLWNA